VITYPPHFPHGSTDKLYEIDGELTRTVRPESVGGTHANRMIHVESNQLFIGPYVIDEARERPDIPSGVLAQWGGEANRGRSSGATSLPR